MRRLSCLLLSCMFFFFCVSCVFFIMLLLAASFIFLLRVCFFFHLPASLCIFVPLLVSLCFFFHSFFNLLLLLTPCSLFFLLLASSCLLVLLSFFHSGHLADIASKMSVRTPSSNTFARNHLKEATQKRKKNKPEHFLRFLFQSSLLSFVAFSLTLDGEH